MSKPEFKFPIFERNTLNKLIKYSEEMYKTALQKDLQDTNRVANAIKKVKKEFVQQYMDDPIDAAICANIMFHTMISMEARQNHYEVIYKFNFSSLIAKEIGSPFHDSPLRTDLIKLYTFFPEDYKLLAFDNPDIKELKNIFEKFTLEEKDSIRKKIESLVPNLSKDNIKKLETFIQKARKKVIECYPLYFAQANALQDLLKYHCITITEFHERKNNIINALADKLLQSASREKELKIKSSMTLEARYYQEFEAPYYMEHPHIICASISDIKKKSKKADAWRNQKSEELEKKLKEIEQQCYSSSIDKNNELEKSEKIKEKKDPWELNNFEQKIKFHYPNNKSLIFLILCEACKTDNRLSHVHFILNQLNEEDKGLLLNQNTTPSGQDTLTPLQCAVQANATQVAILLLNTHKLNHTNLEKALTLTKPNDKLASKITVAIKKTEIAIHAEEKDKSPPPTSSSLDSPLKKITSNDLHKELDELAVKQKELKSWISPDQFQISLKEDKFDHQSSQNLQNCFNQLKLDFNQLQIDTEIIKKQIPNDETKSVAEDLVILSKNIEALTAKQAKLNKDLTEIPNKIMEIEKQIQQGMLAPINPSKKIKKIKTKRESQKKQKDQRKIEVKEPVSIDTPKEVEDKKIEISIYDPQLSIWKPLLQKSQEKTPKKLEDKEVRCQLLTAYCDFKPKNSAEELVLYNAILFRVQQYMVIQSTADLPPQYLD